MFPFTLNAPVGFGLDNDEDDVKSLATNLSALGYPEAQPAANSGLWDGGVENGLRDYQRQRGLTVDGWARPGGATERSLNGGVAGANAARHDAVSAVSPRRTGVDGNGGFFERIAALRGRDEGGKLGSASNLLGVDVESLRANPFAIARANAVGAGALDHGDLPFAARGAGDSLFAHNTINGQPLRLKPLASSPDGIDPPAAPALEDVERILTNRGFRYRPDPMGRVGEGDWLDSEGKVFDAPEKQRIIDVGIKASSILSHGIRSVEDLDRAIEQLPVAPGSADASDEDESVTLAQDEGGGRAWARFAEALAKGGRIIGGTNPIPAELARRLSHIKDPNTRVTLERMIAGGVPDKGGKFPPKEDYNLFKLGGRTMASIDFFYAKQRLGGGPIKRDDKTIYFEGRDGTRVSLRRTLKDKTVTTEIHIDRPDLSAGVDRIKIRYEDDLYRR